MKNFVWPSRLSSEHTSPRSIVAAPYLFAILLTLAPFAAAAQSRPIDSPTGSLHGTVSVISPDGQSHGAPGAQVRLTGAAKDTFQLTIADDSGQYKFDSLCPGNYQLEVTLDGFEEVTKPMIVCAGETNVENIQLVTKSARKVTAKAERVGLNLRDSESATVFKQPASETDPATSQRLRHSVLLSMKSSPAGPSAAFEGASRPHFLRAPDQVFQTPKFSAPTVPALTRFNLSVSPKVSFKNSNHSRRTQFPDVQGSYPRDFQGNLAHTKFGLFSNGVGRMFGMRIVIEKK